MMNQSKNLFKLVENGIKLNKRNQMIFTNNKFSNMPTNTINHRTYFTNSKFLFSSQPSSPINNEKKDSPITSTEEIKTNPIDTATTIINTTTTTTSTNTTTTTTTPTTNENVESTNTTNENSNTNNTNNTNTNTSTNEPPPKTLGQKIISKIKWTLIISSIAGSIGFLFFESYLRNTMPYKMTMNAIDKDVEVLREFGGHITGLKWYKCFINPIFGWVQNEEGGYKSWTTLRIPISRYIAPPPPKAKEGAPIPEPIILPEDELFAGYDGGAQEGIVYVRFNKNSANFYDWNFTDLRVETDTGKIIKIYDSEKSKSKIN